jgi:hypothetical protein
MGRYAKSTDLNGSKVFVQLPKGTTTEQPSSPYGGMIRFNTSLNKLEYYNGTSWLALSGGVGGAATITVDTFTILDEDNSGTPRDSYSPLSLTPAADQNVLVFLGGVYQPPSAYNINTDSTSPYIKMLALVSGDIGSSLVVIHGFDSV